MNLVCTPLEFCSLNWSVFFFFLNFKLLAIGVFALGVGFAAFGSPSLILALHGQPPRPRPKFRDELLLRRGADAERSDARVRDGP